MTHWIVFGTGLGAGAAYLALVTLGASWWGLAPCLLVMLGAIGWLLWRAREA